MEVKQYFFSLLTLTIVSIRADNDVQFDCTTQEDLVDCSKRDFQQQLKLMDLVNTTRYLLYDKNNIKAIRVMEPSRSISNVSFKFNAIVKIEPEAFASLTNLSSLDLSHNRLTTECLKPLVFKGPNTKENMGTLSLKVLYLNSNALHSLHQDLFEFLGDLEELYLSSNPLKTLDHGILTALSSLHKARILDLSSTKLTDLPSNWLNALKNLETLNLSMNYFLTVPKALEEARGLRHLILNDNLITTLSSVPKLPTLHILDLNWMTNLTSVEAHSLVNLPNLRELSIANNKNLEVVSEDALIEPGSYDVNRTEGAVFPPLTKLDLSNNKLGYLEENLFDRWDKMKVLKLDSNPWVCDCKNQWMVSKLVPLMSEYHNGAPNTLICELPIEMKGKEMVELSTRSYHMRCLDMYGNQPDKDAKILIIVLVVILVAIPVSLLFLHLVRKPRGHPGYPSAYYRRTRSLESMSY